MKYFLLLLNDFNHNYFKYSGSRIFASWEVRCKGSFSAWVFGGRDLYAETIGVWGQREGEISVQVEEKLVWLKASSKAVVFEIWQVYGRTRL